LNTMAVGNLERNVSLNCNTNGDGDGSGGNNVRNGDDGCVNDDKFYIFNHDVDVDIDNVDVDNNIDADDTKGTIGDGSGTRVEVRTVDWCDPSTYQTSSANDTTNQNDNDNDNDDTNYIIGADLVYSASSVPVFVNTIDLMLQKQQQPLSNTNNNNSNNNNNNNIGGGGRFIYVCPSGGRDGLDELLIAMNERGFEKYWIWKHPFDILKTHWRELLLLRLHQLHRYYHHRW